MTETNQQEAKIKFEQLKSANVLTTISFQTVFIVSERKCSVTQKQKKNYILFQTNTKC